VKAGLKTLEPPAVSIGVWGETKSAVEGASESFLGVELVIQGNFQNGL
jgi:hypothetical protein